MPGGRKTVNDLTVMELKEQLRIHELPVHGNKNELIVRLLEAHPELEDAVFGGEVEPEGNTASPRRDDPLVERPRDTADAFNRRELELLRREREILRKEVQILQRERDLTPCSGEGSSAMQSTAGIKTISELLPEFSGETDDFRNWRQHLNLLRETYQLEDGATKILVSLRLRKKALKWFHSRASHLEMPIAEFLDAMSAMFDHRPSRLALRREFENRSWRKGEAFCEYYFDKITLANKITVDSEELIDLVIDGIPDVRLRDQARMHRLERVEDVLDAFRKITLGDRPGTGRDRGGDGRPTPGSCRREEAPRSQTRCFNCNEQGHVKKNCAKPLREWGSCYRCGSAEHRVGNCPRGFSSAEAPRSGARRGETSAHLVQPTSPEVPFVVPISFTVPNECCDEINFVISAMIDSGSPISLIRSGLLPLNSYTVDSSQSCAYQGVNHSPLKVRGIFEKTVNNDSIPMSIRFFVVPDNTMSYAAILGRDYMMSPLIKLTLGNEFKIVKVDSNLVNNESDNFIGQIMKIDYIGAPGKVSENLDINPEIDRGTSSAVREMFGDESVVPNNFDSPSSNIEMIIKLTSDQPIAFRPRRLAFAEKEKLRKILEDLCTEKIIRPSSSPYASPIVLVRKKNGEMRLCVDFRELNKITRKDNFPAPNIDDCIDQLREKKYFTTLDLKSGFYHVRVSEASIKFTSFVTPLGQFEFLRMPFGLTNAPRVFQRFVNSIFRVLIDANKILIYLDDILIATETLDEHLSILREVFRLAKEYDLRFRLDKCSFLYREVTYLGYLIDEFGIRPSQEGVKSVMDYPIPRATKEVQRFLGLASYFRRFIPGFSVLAKPLYDLLRKDVPFYFGQSESDAFTELKSKLASEPVLTVYSPVLKTELHCDASANGFGAVLVQKQADGFFRPVFYFSKRTTVAESKYPSFELECLAVIHAIKRFHVYLYGIRFKIITDCDSFRLTLAKQRVNPRIARWAIFLQNYDYEIEHRPGSKMSHVDALSRCIFILEPNTFERILSIKQTQDAKIAELRDKLEKGEQKYYELRDGLIYKKLDKDRLLFYVPECMENNVIRNCHDDLGHLGVDKVVENICRVYWFPQIRKKVKDYINNCLKCIEFSPPSGRSEGYLHSIDKGNLPFKTIHIDHFGPLEKSNGMKHILSIVDGFTKFIKLYPCRSTTTAETIKHLKEYFRNYSKPCRLISDRGTSFTSVAFREFLAEKSVEHVLIATATPRANGQVERFNRVLTPMLAKLTECPNKWEGILSDVEFALNNSVCRSTGETPSRLLFGINQLGNTDDNLRRVLSSSQKGERDLLALRYDTNVNIKKSQLANEKAYDRKRKPATVYQVGDYVMISNRDVTPGVNKKLIPKFKGPYVVTKVLDSDRYVVNDVEGHQITRVPYTGIVGPDQMRHWIREIDK